MIQASLSLLFLVWLLDGFKKRSTRPRQTQLIAGYAYIAALVIGAAGIVRFLIETIWSAS